MTPNHPNRSKRKDAPGRTPTPGQLVAAREAAELTQEQAAALIYSSPTGWKKWERGERRMHPAFWELFCEKSGAATEDAEAARTALKASRKEK